MSAAYPAATAETARGDALREIRDIVGKKRLRALMARRDGPGLAFLAGHLGLLALGGGLVWSALGTLWVVPATFAHGIVIVHLFAPYHEAIHYTAFRTRWLNTALGWFGGLVLMLPPLVFRHQHDAHHAHTQDLARDPQMIAMGESLGGYLYYATAIPYLQDILRVLLGHPFGRLDEGERRNVPAPLHGAVRAQAWQFWAVYAGLAGLSLGLGTWAVVTYWLIPRLAGEPVMRLIRMSEHVGCARNDNMLENSRTILAVAPVRWLAWNMPYHAAHHAVPQVPFHAIPALNAALLPHMAEVRPGYASALRYQWQNARRPAAA